MLKLIAMIRRKPGLTRQQFVDYYENRHVPFVTGVNGKYLLEYKRNYVQEELTTSIDRTFDGYDVITEVWLENREALAGLLAMMSQPPWAAELTADEDNFVDRPSMRMFVTEEYRPGEMPDRAQ
jgi:hypothetical protein